MSRTAASVRRIIVAAVLASTLTLAGCASGKISQTASQVAAENGGNGKVGQIDVLNVQFETPSGTAYPKGSSAPLNIWVSNDSIAADVLTDVSTPAASKVDIAGTATAPPQSLEDFGTKYKITLTGLTNPLSYGVSVPVTFTFRTAGSVTVNVPVAIPGERTSGRPSIQLAPSQDGSIWQSGSASGQG